ncbi:MAG: YbaB/EbfC family nucleoid-associated protein [Planctomycetota bacterium]|nr:MAG: YbaB/EbfC family nucleoid-associated protein [Planctomycetota bacterium]
MDGTALLLGAGRRFARRHIVLKGLSNLANLPGIFKQAQEMGAKLQQLNAELKTKKVTGAAGGGLVEVDANGVGDVLAVRIDASLIEKQDRELLEDLLPAAINAAHAKAKELHAQSMQSLAGGLDLPGLSDALGGLGSLQPPG